MARAVLLLTFLLSCLLPRLTLGQESDRATTERRLQELQRLIEDEQKRLSQTREAERASMETLEQLDRQIALRTELVRTYRRRVRQLSEEGDSLRRSMSALEQDLGRLKGQYRDHAIHAYKYGRMHDLALILAAKSINQVLIRVNYLRRFGQQRKERLQAIADAGSALQQRRARLDSMLVSNERLLKSTQEETRNLAQLQENRKRVIAGLRAQRSQLEADLAQHRAAVNELNSRIRALAESASNRRRAEETSNPTAAAAFVELTGSFQQNRGRLPWPANGVVREPFGDIVNPVYGTRTPNPGILIDTPSSSDVRAVFNGRVVEVSVLPDFGTYVSIEHGEFQSVYSNFSTTFVNEGDQVRAGQVIGRSGTDDEPKGRAVFFALFRKGVAFDPQPWLSRQ